jgi:hypothetical protein
MRHVAFAKIRKFLKASGHYDDDMRVTVAFLEGFVNREAVLNDDQVGRTCEVLLQTTELEGKEFYMFMPSLAGYINSCH